MKRKPLTITWAAIVLFGLVVSANATFTTITYDVSPGVGGAWTYTYTVHNDSPSRLLEDLIVYFREPTDDSPDFPVYEISSVASVPSGWDVTIYDSSQPNLSAYSEFTAQSGGIPAGGSQGGFSVSFSYYGPGTPGNQFYEVYDASFNVLEKAIFALDLPPRSAAQAVRSLLPVSSSVEPGLAPHLIHPRWVRVFLNLAGAILVEHGIHSLGKAW
jgi:hypothetical protein